VVQSESEVSLQTTDNRQRTADEARWLLSAVCCLILIIALPLCADTADDDNIAAQLHARGARIEQPRVIVWYRAADLHPSTAQQFAERLSSGVGEVETVLGTKYDARHHRQAKIECFIDSDAGMSHSYMGVKPYFFVTPERVNAREVPYRHELTHIVAWWSCDKAFWLQEGFADYVSSEARRRFRHEPEYDANVFNPHDENIDAVAARVSDSATAAKVMPLIGVDATPMSLRHRRAFDAIFADREVTAPAFYNLSHSFTRFVVNRVGLEKLEAACRTFNPSRTIARDADTTPEQLRDAWLKSIR
jgi:hypothetical protein